MRSAPHSPARLATAARLFLLGMAFLTLPLPLSAAELAGQVIGLEGTAQVIRARQENPLALGAPLYLGDEIATGADSRVEVGLLDGALLFIGPDTRLAIADYESGAVGGPVSRTLALVAGIVRALVPNGSPQPSFVVEGRTAVASVRGTEFVVETSPDKTSVFVAEGTVSVAAPAAAAIELAQDFGVDVAAGATLLEPKRWGAARVADVLNRTRTPGAPPRQ